jgi:dihydrofolate reductase
LIIGIWAEDENRLIGNGDKIPWNFPEDLEFFWSKVEGQKVVCGRKTYQSLKKYGVINKFKQVYVLTRDVNFDRNNNLEENVATIKESCDLLVSIYKNNKNSDLYVIGGASVYKLFEPYYDKVFVTTIDGYYKGDTFIDVSYWEMKHKRDVMLSEKVMVSEFDGYVSNYLLEKHLDRLYELSLIMRTSPLKIYTCLLSSLGKLSYNIHNRVMFEDDFEFVQRVNRDLSEILNLYALYKFKQGKVKKLDFNINWIEDEQVENMRTDEGNLFVLAKSVINENDGWVFSNIMTLMLSFGIELQDILEIEETGCL